MGPATGVAATPTGAMNGSASASARSSPAVGNSSGQAASKAKSKANANGPNLASANTPLSSLSSVALDLTSVERRGHPTEYRETTTQPKARPSAIPDAPTYFPNEEEWRDPVAYIQSISAQAQEYGICKIVPPSSWNPGFSIDTEKFHFKTRKQELNSVEGSTRANLSYLDGLGKFHKQQGSNLHRLPYVDKKPLDLYRLKKAVESRGGFDNVCRQKKWAEIGRDLGYSGKIMSSLSTSLKNSYQRWLCPYEEYLRLAKPGVHQQLEAEYGGPFTPSPANTPMKRSNVNTPLSVKGDSPARQASEALQSSVNGIKSEKDRDTPMVDAAPLPKPAASGFTAVNSGGFRPVNAGFTSVNRQSSDRRSFTPDTKRFDSPAIEIKNPESRPSSALAGAAPAKRLSSMEGSADSPAKDGEGDSGDGENSSRRSKRLKKSAVPTVAGSHMSVHRPSVPRVPRGESVSAGEKCETCGKGEDAGFLAVCESCDHIYHGACLDPPLARKPDAEWNCPRCLVGDGQYGFEDGGLYSLRSFQQKANDFKRGYFENKMPFDSELNCHRPVTEEDVEREFWRLVADLEETVEVEYGADIHCTTHGSGFPTVEKNPNNPYATDPWNLNVLPFHPDSLFRHIKSDISGMTVPWVYVGMIFSTFCWHNEDHYAYSANYQHFGATKTWYGIPGADAEKFEAAMREAVPELFETQPDLLFQLVTLLTPEQLKKAGVRVFAVDQRAGQFVITFPQAYHAGFNHGFNFNEAVNFAPSDWEPFGLAGVERLQAFRRQPCFSHDELLWTAAEGSTTTGLTIQTAKWLAPALDRMVKRETTERDDFWARHAEAPPHKCSQTEHGGSGCSLTISFEDEDVKDEEEQCCSYCKAFAYLSRFKCLESGKVLCIAHAGLNACCSLSEQQRCSGEGHVLILRKTSEMMASIHSKVVEKAETPQIWEDKYESLLDGEIAPSLKSLRALLHEGERIPHALPSLPALKQFVDRCNEWVEEAMTYIVRKQQNRRKNERGWQSGARKSIGGAEHEQKERDARHVSNIARLLNEAERIGFDCPEILQLQERADAVKAFQSNAIKALKNASSMSVESIEELLEEGRSFNVDMPEVDDLSKSLDELRWNQKARASRGVFLTLREVEDLIEEGKRLELPSWNDHFQYFREQLRAGQAWEKKARELIYADMVHFPQLEALSTQVQVNALPVSQETLSAVDQIMQRQREAHRQIMDLTDRCKDPDFRKRPKYAEVVEMTKKLEDLNSKPKGTIELEMEKKRHEDWMRKGKRLFGKSNAPLHILKNHLEYVLERNNDCFDIDHDTPRHPGEPNSRETSVEPGTSRLEDAKTRQVFCICRKIEAGMMIECELCHEWYHYKCLKIARGKVKEDDKYTCPVCDWRMKIPRDASRPKLEDLVALAEEIPGLPFQPDEEDILEQILDNAQTFRDHVARYCNPLVSTAAEAETQRFYLRKLEGAEILLTFETNFFRQELHKWCPVAPEAPPILEVSLSTRKPRPTKLMKMLVEYGVDNPDDLPESVKGKANSLRRKAANAEAAAAAALATHSSIASTAAMLPHASDGSMDHDDRIERRHSSSNAAGSAVDDTERNIDPSLDVSARLEPRRHSMHSPATGVGGNDPMDIDHPRPTALGDSGPQVVVNDNAMSLEEKLMAGKDINLESTTEKTKALEILSRTDMGKKKAEEIFGSDVWNPSRASHSDDGRPAAADGDVEMKEDDSKVDEMFREMTNQDEDEDVKKKDAEPVPASQDAPVTEASVAQKVSEDL
ncbi:PLU-1-like protein [Sarocladium implicatum]|nr:PLU-1-like protein [Sarocladium implicatum]